MRSCDGVDSNVNTVFCCCPRHPDKLRVVWIRRNRRHMTKVRLSIAEATVQHVQGSYNKTLILARFLHSSVGGEKIQIAFPVFVVCGSPTPGNRGSQTPTEAWSSGSFLRTWTSQSLSLRYEEKHVLGHVTRLRRDNIPLVARSPMQRSTRTRNGPSSLKM